MYTCSLHIVALPYYEVGECLGDFFAEAEGRAMTLRPEPTNDYDARAIQAFDWQGRHVGYVASADLLEAWQALRGSGRHSLRGKIRDLNVEHKCIVFECKVETIGDVPNLYPESPFLEWHYSGPVMKPTKEMVKLDYMMDEICERLDEHDSWTTDDRDDFMKLGGRFCEVTKYDLSGDMADYRRRLILRMLALKDADLMPLVEELKMAYGRAGRESHEGDVLNYWMTVLSDSAVTRTLLKNRHKYDVDVVRQELQQFPESMYEEWLDNREHFVSKLLYMHIPRTTLWQLVSGIAFVEIGDVIEAGGVKNATNNYHEGHQPESDTKDMHLDGDKKVLHIESVASGDIEKLISAFFKDGAEEAEVLEKLEDESISSARNETKPLENRVLKKNHNGKCIDFQVLHKLIGESFVNEIKYSYEWLAPWRMLYDLRLLEDTTLTAFAEQMNKWYPDAKKPCNADSMGDYFNPYLGSTVFVLWDENEFKKRKTSKQSINGYRLLYNDCEAIKEALKSFFKQ